MENKGAFTKILAIAGTALMWLPLLAPILIGVVFFAGQGEFLVDYLMPAELFPVALIGGGLLIWAALRARSHLKLIAGGLVLAIALLVGLQWVAEITGLANGDTQPGGWQWALVMGMLAAFIVALAAAAVGGILLLRDLFKPSALTPQTP